MVSLSVNATPVAEYIQRLVSMQHLFRNALAGQKLCLLSRPTQTLSP